MIVDLFNELQWPGPTGPDVQGRVFAGALEQAELADRLGYGCWWSVEHHCTPEFSHSGAPELMNAAVAMRLGEPHKASWHSDSGSGLSEADAGSKTCHGAAPRPA